MMTNRTGALYALNTSSSSSSSSLWFHRH